MQRRRSSWALAGVGLVGCGVLAMLRGSFGYSPAAIYVGLLADLLWAAAAVVFAIGRSAAESVVARAPLGVASLLVVALWPLASTVTVSVLDADRGADWTAFGYLSIFIPVAAGAVACMQIARARTVPSPWRWAPLWVLAAQAALWAIPQILLVAVGPAEFPYFAGALSALGTLSVLAPTLGLGILALVLAARTRADTVQIYRST